jgi:hypothetical protein
VSNAISNLGSKFSDKANPKFGFGTQRKLLAENNISGVKHNNVGLLTSKDHIQHNEPSPA